MAIRASQLVGEIQLHDVSYVLVSQQIVEANVSDISYVRVSQVAAETLAADISYVRASQLGIEGLLEDRHPARVSALYVLVLCNVVGREMPATFPTLIGLGYDVIKRPIAFTEVGQSASGREVRVAYSDVNVWEWELSYEYLPDFAGVGTTASDLKTLMGFFVQTRANLLGFLFKDPDDHTMTDQLVGTTDGATNVFTISRLFNGSADSPYEPIGYVDLVQTFQVRLAGVLQDPSTYDIVTTVPCAQTIRFHSTPTTGQAVSITCTFYFYARFKDPQNDFEKFADKFWATKKIVLRSLRG